MKTTTTTYYTATGPARGECGHRHRTIEGAQRCATRDGEGCASQGGYSDREVGRLDGEPLTAAERRRLYELAEAALDAEFGW